MPSSSTAWLLDKLGAADPWAGGLAKGGLQLVSELSSKGTLTSSKGGPT